ncbi:MAG: type II toxin-antitoxin system prevent-host-death family antitoxin [Ignavibacteriae bacterium]|nr:type II toxin-antitoxin system prevent-host-death family antitoxin [Ignavibacteriota bacterium]
MPVIKPISDLRNKSNEISKLAREADEPIFITRNGVGDLVVMSLSHYGKLQMKAELHGKLAIAQAQRASGEKGKTLHQVVQSLRKKINEST